MVLTDSRQVVLLRFFRGRGQIQSFRFLPHAGGWRLLISMFIGKGYYQLNVISQYDHAPSVSCWGLLEKKIGIQRLMWTVMGGDMDDCLSELKERVDNLGRSDT